jgi:hypothetical protein
LFCLITNAQLKLSVNSHLHKRHSSIELQKDIDFVFKKIKKLHPNLYQFISKEKLEFKLDSVKKSISKPLTSEEFFFVLTPLINEIRQGHNQVFYPLKKNILGFTKNQNEFTLLECFDFEYLDEKIIISKSNCNTNNSLTNTTVLAVQGKPTSYFLNKYKVSYKGDGYNQTFEKRMPGLFFKNIIYNEYFNLDSITLSLSLNDSLFDTTFYKYRYYQNIDEYDPYDDEYIKLIPWHIDEMLDYKDSISDLPSVSCHYNDTFKELAILTIKDFESTSSKKYDTIFNELDSFNTKHLIIDLRNNLGGSLGEVYTIIKYLEKDSFILVRDPESSTRIPFTRSIWNTDEKGIVLLLKSIISPFIATMEQFKASKKNDKIIVEQIGANWSNSKKNNYKGKVFILINGNSFSASSFLAAYLQGSNRAIVVGEESGGAFNGCVAGYQKNITAPHSKLEVSFGMLYLKTIYTQTPDGYGVIPDYTILPILEHRKKGIDTELEFVLKQIREENVIDKRSEEL